MAYPDDSCAASNARRVRHLTGEKCGIFRLRSHETPRDRDDHEGLRRRDSQRKGEGANLQRQRCCFKSAEDEAEPPAAVHVPQVKTVPF